MHLARRAKQLDDPNTAQAVHTVIAWVLEKAGELASRLLGFLRLLQLRVADAGRDQWP